MREMIDKEKTGYGVRGTGEKSQAASRSFWGGRVCIFLLIAALAFACFSCSKPKAGHSRKTGKSTTEKKSPVKKTVRGAAPLANGAFNTISPEVLGDVANEQELKDLHNRGLLKAAVPCNRPGMCMMNQYDVAVGFEVVLVRKIAERGFGIKENIVEPGTAGADVRLAVSCKAPGGNDPALVPYFHRAGAGWLCIRVLSGSGATATAIRRIVQHFYDTGTFQQVYKNWFPPAATDIVPQP
jgi:hypothetical protein